jgi:hypothetical protein
MTSRGNCNSASLLPVANLVSPSEFAHRCYKLGVRLIRLGTQKTDKLFLKWTFFRIHLSRMYMSSRDRKSILLTNVKGGSKDNDIIFSCNGEQNANKLMDGSHCCLLSAPKEKPDRFHGYQKYSGTRQYLCSPVPLLQCIYRTGLFRMSKILFQPQSLILIWKRSGCLLV